MNINKITANPDKECVSNRIAKDITNVQIILSDFEAMTKHPHYIEKLSYHKMEILNLGKEFLALSAFLLDFTLHETGETSSLSDAVHKYKQTLRSIT